MTQPLEGRVAYVTGAASGIGEATVDLMAQQGAKVVVADLNMAGAELVADRLRSSGTDALALELDVTDPEAVDASYDAVIAKFGRLDVLHLNAGGDARDDTNVVDTPLDAWDFAFRVNVMGVVHGLKFGIPRMLETGGGNIVVTSSMGGQAGDYARIAYGSLKATVTALVKYVSVSHGRAGININAVLPALTLSAGAAAQFPPPLAAAVAKHQTTDRINEPADVAALVAFLASDAARGIRGQAIQIDAGGSAQGGASPTLAAAIADLMAQQQGKTSRLSGGARDAIRDPMHQVEDRKVGGGSVMAAVADKSLLSDCGVCGWGPAWPHFGHIPASSSGI
jgi:NAD(P)-dependent dehydrogenase (short-subunit alcohol dehydrogenase family)